MKEMILRPDLLDSLSHKNLEVFQLTTEHDIPSCHVYMESQIFTPDSKRFLLHRSAHPHGSDKNDPDHCYLLCDLENKGSLLQVTDELGVTAPSVSPDGKYFYYFVDETELNGGRLSLKRRNIDGTAPEVICVLDKPVPGTSFLPSNIYPLSTIRSDGRKIALSARLGDGDNPDNWGLLIFDVQTATAELILQGPTWCNTHAQFSRSRDPQKMRDILVQENHGYKRPLDGSPSSLVSGPGVDIHVIRDDGRNLRDMPWGRNGDEKCQGHQCWRGRSDWAITSTSLISANECQLIESKPCVHAGHRGIATPGGIRHHLSRNFPGPGFYHFATDIEGSRLITDYRNYENSEYGHYPTSIFLADLGEPGVDAPNFTFLLGLPTEHAVNIQHPFLSPDGKMAFFNSDESGVLQAYMIRGLPR